VSVALCELQILFCYINNAIKNKEYCLCNAGELSTPHRHIKVLFVDRKFKRDKNNVEELPPPLQQR